MSLDKVKSINIQMSHTQQVLLLEAPSTVFHFGYACTYHIHMIMVTIPGSNTIMAYSIQGPSVRLNNNNNSSLPPVWIIIYYSAEYFFSPSLAVLCLG
jgi:hypothetical protein